MELSERKKRILNAIVEEYILTGEPVGSKFLANQTGLGLSSATIRNEMADLSELGYLEQPHTSAGRVPTHLGYRLYVDQLMGHYTLTEKERKALDGIRELGSGDIESILEKASDILAEVTGCTAVSTAPNESAAQIKRIEVVPAGTRSLLLVILTTSGVVKSCICRIDEDVTAEMVEFFSRLVNDHFCGRTLDTITPQLLAAVKGRLFEYTYALSPVLDIIYEEIKSAGSEVIIGGTTNLLANSEFDHNRIVEILKFLQQRKELLRIIDSVKNGVHVCIGEESGIPIMDNSAIIAAPYAFKGKVCGAVGIIGPARINYPRMISNIRYFSSILSRFINDTFGD